MGIHGLSKLIADNAPGAIKEQKFDNYFGRKIAVDASMHIYQFLIVVGRQGDTAGLMDEAGNVTSHLVGMFNRTARMLQAGIKPVYVFDGKPPQLKKDELSKRLVKRDDATAALEQARETGDKEALEKYGKRTVRVTKEHNEECKRLLTLMGVPVIDAPSEAEAQCAAMCKAGLVYAIATEDMDALTFQTPKLVRHLMAPQNAKTTIDEFDYEKVLEGLELTTEQFVDMCILCGCDYCGTIRGIGAKSALKLMQQHKSLEKVVESLDKSKYNVPEPYPIEEVRQLFHKPEVLEGETMPQLKWTPPDEQGLVDYLVGEKGFKENRVRETVAKINATKTKAQQGRLESFFGPTTTKPAEKRKEPPASKASAAKGAKKGKLGALTKKK